MRKAKYRVALGGGVASSLHLHGIHKQAPSVHVQVKTHWFSLQITVYVDVWCAAIMEYIAATVQRRQYAHHTPATGGEERES